MRVKLLSTLISLLTLAVVPSAALAAFAPTDRTTLQCVDTRNCPGPNYITFNAFTDAPNSDAPNGGDERAFFEAKDASSTSTLSGFSDNLSVQDGQRILMRVYIHNAANPNLLGAEAATAHNTAVLVQLPAAASTPYSAIAYLSATGAQPHMISDTATFNGSSPISLTFDTNFPVNVTARNNGQGNFVTHQASGVSFGDNQNLTVNLGDWPGGFANHGSVTFTAIAHSTSTPAPTPAISCNLTVSKIDSTRATVTAQANPANANVSSYAFTTKNSSGTVIDSVNTNTNASTAAYNFNQSNPDTYMVSAVVSIHQGRTRSSACNTQIIVPAQPVTLSTSTTSTPTVTSPLPNTGAGDTIAIFSGVSTFAGVLHYLIKTRRFSF